MFLLVFIGILSILGSFSALTSLKPLFLAQFWLFGYFGYIWLFIIAYYIWKMQCMPNFKSPIFLEKVLGVVIGVFALLVLQGLFFNRIGIFGNAFNSVLVPLITSFGVFLVALVLLGFSVVLFSGKSPKELWNLVIKDLKEDMQYSKNTQRKSQQKLKQFLLKARAFFTLENKKSTIKPQKIESKNDITPRPLTLEELIAQNKNNPPPKESIAFDFTQETKQESEEYCLENDEKVNMGFEEGIDVLRQDIELPTRESDLLEIKKDADIEIRVISKAEAKQDNFDVVNFEKQSIANLENFKKFEKNYVQNTLKTEQKDDEIIKIIKAQNVDSAQDTTLQQEPKKPIKEYPKDLYSATPFKAHYDKNPPIAQDGLLNTAKIQDKTGPSTIFYYGDVVATQPLSDVEIMDKKVSEQLKSIQKDTQELPLQEEQIVQTSPLQEVSQTIQSAESTQEEQMAQPLQESLANNTEQIQQIAPQIVEVAQEMQQPEITQNPKEEEQDVEIIQLFSKPKTLQTIEPVQEVQAQIMPQTQESIPQMQIIPPLQESLADHTPQTQHNPSFANSTQEVQNIQPKNANTKVTTLSENAMLLQELNTNQVAHTPKNSDDFILPKLEFLQAPKEKHFEIDESEIDRKVNDLLGKLRMFKIDGDIVRTYSGPIVTTFEFRPSPNVKVSRILTLQDDLAMALKAKTIRIQAPIPGKDVVGIEIPNNHIATIYLREVFESDVFKNSTSPLTLALGKDIVGNPFVTDLKKLPHLLIAGTTGSGKSVGINAMILSLLYKNSPKQLRLVMIDPKMLEFSIYNDIPHLLTPVITAPKKAIIALDRMVKEMEHRYELMSEARVKNIEGYNEKAEIEGFESFPYIVIVIDELADLMMSGGKEAEISISRLAQMARASGIHLIVATQRPSVDVVTGLIKANLPSRISYKVGQKIDSKVILDTFGAESLLGRGDMLFTPPGGGIVRLHAPWSDEKEIAHIADFIKAQQEPQYDPEFIPSESESLGLKATSETDEFYEEAKRIILTDRKTSASYLQRRLGVGFNRASNIIEQMEARGFLSKTNAKGVREIIGE